MATTIDDIATQLDAHVLDRCPRCDRPTWRRPHGHARLCLPCTETDIGLSWWQNARRIELGMTAARYLATDDLIPRTPREYRQWVSRGGTPPTPAPARRRTARRRRRA